MYLNVTVSGMEIYFSPFFEILTKPSKPPVLLMDNSQGFRNIYPSVTPGNTFMNTFKKIRACLPSGYFISFSTSKL